jgi:long-chain acyl-CoA synthetase
MTLPFAHIVRSLRWSGKHASDPAHAFPSTFAHRANGRTSWSDCRDSSDVATAGATTIPALLLEQARARPDRPALREKEYGIWRTFTWREHASYVERLAMGLHEMGCRDEDRVLLIGDNRRQLYWALLAAQSLRAIPVPVYQDSKAEEVRFILEDTEARWVVAENQEQVDKVLSVIDDCPFVEKALFIDPKGLRRYRHPKLESLEGVLSAGRRISSSTPSLYESMVKSVREDDIAIISYTSGTTAAPKGAMLSHSNLISSALLFMQVFPFRATDELLAYLPMAWLGDTYWSVVIAALTGCCVNIPERPETAMRDMREAAPTFLVAPPRIWESLARQVQVAADDADWVKRTFYKIFLDSAVRQVAEAGGARLGPWRKLWQALGEVAVYGPVKDLLGLKRVRFAVNGGAALAPEVLRFFRTMGIDLRQAYGLTENAIAATAHRKGSVRADTVGEPILGVDVKLSEEGEILIRSPGVFQGYWRRPAETEATLRDGWLHTGDTGFFTADGHLVVVGRLKEVGRLADGSPFSPDFIENKLKFSPFIRDAVAFGPGQPFVVALLALDAETVGRWAQKRGVAYTSYTDLVTKDAVLALALREVARVNQSLPAGQRVRRFVVLPKQLDPDDAELTRTRKVRRGAIQKRYAHLLEAMYAGRRHVEAAVTIVYEDGRTADVPVTLAVIDVEDDEGPTGIGWRSSARGAG